MKNNFQPFIISQLLIQFWEYGILANCGNISLQNNGITLSARVTTQINAYIDNYPNIEQVKGKLMK